MKEIKMITKSIVASLPDKHGKYAYADMHSGDVVSSRRPCVVTNTQFIQTKIAEGKIKLLLPNLPKEANDSEFKQFLDDSGETKLAIAAYASKFGLDELGNKFEFEVPSFVKPEVIEEKKPEVIEENKLEAIIEEKKPAIVVKPLEKITRKSLKPLENQ
jgi:hypothetical protein